MGRRILTFASGVMAYLAIRLALSENMAALLADPVFSGVYMAGAALFAVALAWAISPRRKWWAAVLALLMAATVLYFAYSATAFGAAGPGPAPTPYPTALTTPPPPLERWRIYLPEVRR